MKLNLSNTTYIVGVNHVPPFNLIKWNRESNSYEIIGGIEGRMFLTLSEYFNFSMKFVHIKNDFGYLTPNGTWTGMIGDISRHKLDLGLSGTAMTHNRNLVVKYLYPHWIDTLTFATTAPEDYFTIDLFLKPFDLNVWLCLFIYFLVLALFNRINKRVDVSMGKDIESIKNVVWFSFRVLIRQSSTRVQQFLSNPMKICWICWILATVVLTNCYGGHLFSMMTIPSYSVIDTFDKLAEACRRQQITLLAYKKSVLLDVSNRTTIPSILIVLNYTKHIAYINDGLQMLQKVSTLTRHNHRKRLKMYGLISTTEQLKLAQLKFGKNSMYIPPQNIDTALFPMLIAVPLHPKFQFREEFDQA
ncbi:Ligand-gated ion channel-like protein 2 [Sarcoptes scabiei]|uniref:Ligand-gated ion channel-like protein 2 n=1 Tax=Sarcoptes scabiei TaxID=52283 RepID=A0A132AKT5_SARSC|nr:Ligand-gated ion channel-like protein 2 [Sarcoptes scabiei]